MHSSVGVTGRALFMLACAVAMPILALSGTSWPDVLERLRGVDLQALLQLSNATKSSETNPFANSQPDRIDHTTLAKGLPLPTSTSRNPCKIAGCDPGTTCSSKTSDLPVNRFQPLEEQLRQLGAAYYLLETWGNDQQLYRFFCKMAIGGHPDYTRCFETIDADPIEAMQRTIRDVENWRDGVN